MRKVVLFTGGGSGGHVFPGVAVIEKLRRSDPSLDIRWIGSRSPLEQDIVRRFAIPFLSIPSGKLRRYLSPRNVVDLFKIAAGVVKSLSILSRVKPRLLFSKGGFVSVPPVLAARLLGVPVVSHESDFDPGLATRINSRFSAAICVAYEETRSSFPEALRSRVVVTGNPVRSEIFAGDRAHGRALLGVPDRMPVVLVLGGSQGSQEVNGLAEEAAELLRGSVFVAHQTGRADFRQSHRENYVTADFFADSYPDVLAAADVVVCRSGAGTLWELSALGKPSVLIPLGRASSRGDQLRNADHYRRIGAAVVLEPGRAGAKALVEAIASMLADPERLRSMAQAAASVMRSDASETIADLIRARIGAVHADNSA